MREITLKMNIWDYGKFVVLLFGQKAKGIFKQELKKLFHCKLKGLIIKLNFVQANDVCLVYLFLLQAIRVNHG